MRTKNENLELWDFEWPLMEVLVAGSSSIDLPKLSVHSLEDAYEFLESYGYNPASKADQRELDAIRVESIHFISKSLMPVEWKDGIRPPSEIIDCDDVANLLLFASSKDETDNMLRNWACAVLRVMHTISHINGARSRIPISVARNQIFSKFRSLVFRDGDKLFFGKKGTCVEIDRVDWKPEKLRESIILKLLHKAENVAETIYDLFGIRIVTKRLCDVLPVIKFLRQFYLVPFPNSSPSRVRNTLIDVDNFKRNLSTTYQLLNDNEITSSEFDQKVCDMALRPRKKTGGRINPHSSRSYHSIQLTCRQLVKVENPLISLGEKINREKSKYQDDLNISKVLEEISCLVKCWNSGGRGQQFSAYFPFEVQVMDEEAYQISRTGKASHQSYKASQKKYARKRVLGALLGPVKAK